MVRRSMAGLLTPRWRSWLDDGVAPNGVTGRAFVKESVHGFDLTFAAPKSVSLLRALSGDVNEKVVAEPRTCGAIKAAMDLPA